MVVELFKLQSTQPISPFFFFRSFCSSFCIESKLRVMNFENPRISSIFIVLVLVGLSFEQFVHSQNVGGNQFPSPAAIPFILSMANGQLSNLSSIINSELSSRFRFCSRDTHDDWNRAFNFSSNLEFLSSCLQKTNGDFTKRLCTAAEINFYFDSIILQNPESGSFLKLNKNCNLTSWAPGCEPGWACSVGPDQKVDLGDSQEMPSRMQDCQACCEGFFCPKGLTCMIPCPLGSYCPLAKLNRTTGVCEPYLYQLPPGQPNHTCGGANLWADVGRSKEMFCSDGSFCPSSTQEIPCDSGYYCRMGSTSQNRCFKLTSCDANTTNQNIHAYGVMLLVALSTLLLIIYNFSDQVLAARERRLAKSREAAAKSAKATAKAQQRWKTAKDAAKKHASGLQVQLSRKFSRVKNSDTEKIKILNQSEHEMDVGLSTSHSYVPTTSSASSVHIEGRKDKQTDHIGMIHEIEKVPDGHEEFHSESEVEDIEKHMPKGKHSSTRSQMFKYAYVQLEKEKAQQQENRNLTFSGVIKMATDPENKRRPPIEVSFKDLNLTLKAKNKHLLRCVTGNIKPGRITAVMGPSGAGKTTFLSALAGKAIGCKTTGSILINGKNESILSYKRIMGFVPQDDIVHGNLTVEENLWFSANCRLSVDLSKADKVLIVERVIEFLGLQTVRNSLVGTVEKRGISGGQRKRVNVGLEMVIEPSILLLDEPTSGLDSSSSQLLLRALRREALEGVTICMVVHQPSYTLFKMFDDLVLLAKGGFTVYHGPARRVEEYFAGLGISVPERVNPPDHFIDILEGIVTPNGDISYEELPVRWLLHNGYPVPADLQQNSVRHTTSTADVVQINGTRNRAPVDRQPSLAGELWQGMRNNVEEHHDKLRVHFLKTNDLSHRRTPGIFHQYRYFLGRIGKQRLRDSKIQVIDYLILLLAGACLGSISNVSDQSFGVSGYAFTIIAVSLLGKIAALRTFSLDKLEYWRESSSGMSSLAYFLAKDTVDHFNTAIKPLMYLSMFYSFTNPRSSFTDHYVVLLCLLYCVTGIAYALAILFQPGAAQLWSAILPVVLTLFITRTQTSSALKTLSNLCYPKWAVEALVIANAERYDGVWLITRCGALNRSGFDLHDWGLCLLLLMVTGVIFRILSYVCMLIFRRK